MIFIFDKIFWVFGKMFYVGNMVVFYILGGVWFSSNGLLELVLVICGFVLFSFVGGVFVLFGIWFVLLVFILFLILFLLLVFVIFFVVLSSIIIEISMKYNIIKLIMISIYIIDIDEVEFRNIYLVFVKEKCRVKSIKVFVVFFKGIFW